MLTYYGRISITIVISFGARGLSAIRSEVFCYTAISSASIIGILPGYLICKLFCYSFVVASEALYSEQLARTRLEEHCLRKCQDGVCANLHPLPGKVRLINDCSCAY